MGYLDIEEVTGRIAENLEHLKRFTVTPGEGCTRLPFTKEAREDAVGFCDAEGTRFTTGYFGSAAMMGRIDVEYCRRIKDKAGISIYEAMKGYGLDPERIGEAKWELARIGQFLEVYIEQGPVLDAQKLEIGLTDCIIGTQLPR